MCSGKISTFEIGSLPDKIPINQIPTRRKLTRYTGNPPRNHIERKRIGYLYIGKIGTRENGTDEPCVAAYRTGQIRSSERSAFEISTVERRIRQIGFCQNGPL